MIRIVAAAVALLTVITVLLVARDRGPDFEAPAQIIQNAGLSQPADIVAFQGRYVATEIYNNRLAILSADELLPVGHFDPGSIGKRFHSPHFLAVTPQDTLLISNGWGHSIVEISDLEGHGWKEFSGIGTLFHAPHGLCVDEQGWIYVGDSLNSRLVRFRDLNGTGWQVFRDLDARISYIRELVCRDGAVWASNSYENRPGLNPGQGGNLLRIGDFESGNAEVIATFPDTNVTGLLPITGGTMLIGQWGARRRLATVDVASGRVSVFPRQALGTPYGSYHDTVSGRVLVAYLGRLSAQERRAIGGLAVYQ